MIHLVDQIIRLKHAARRFIRLEGIVKRFVAVGVNDLQITAHINGGHESISVASEVSDGHNEGILVNEVTLLLTHRAVKGNDAVVVAVALKNGRSALSDVSNCTDLNSKACLHDGAQRLLVDIEVVAHTVGLILTDTEACV